MDWWVWVPFRYSYVGPFKRQAVADYCMQRHGRAAEVPLLFSAGPFHRCPDRAASRPLLIACRQQDAAAALGSWLLSPASGPGKMAYARVEVMSLQAVRVVLFFS